MTTVHDVKGDQLLCKRLFPDKKPRALSFPFPPRKVYAKDIVDLPVRVPHIVEDRMRMVSQVTLKDLWIGWGQIFYTRWEHSIGVYNIGQIWLRSLYEGDKVPQSTSTRLLSKDAIKAIAGYAFLLHDYGHLFFSHLFEEALRTINWVPQNRGAPPLETLPLRRRLNNHQGPDADLLEKMKGTFQSLDLGDVDLGIEHVLALIEGRGGIPWLQALVNGAVDADKVDYLGRDHELLETAGYPVGARIQMTPLDDGTMPWLTEFLSEQYVNHAGFLCLPGRSALAAADMWRERVYLYDRFYLAPNIRAADRVVLEILQHFLIRCVISGRFAAEVTTKDFVIDRKQYSIAQTFEKNPFRTLAELMDESHDPVDVRDPKYDACTRLLENMLFVFGDTKERDFEFLTFMWEKIKAWPYIDHRYKSLLESLFQDLLNLRDKKLQLGDFATQHIVGQPIQFPRKMETEVRELVRSLQHQYASDVLIDVCVLPRVLATPVVEGPLGRELDQRFMQLLVPKGDASKWGPSSRALEPLTPDKVQDLERPHGRVTLVATSGGAARAKYVFDRLRGDLRRTGIPTEELEP